MTYDPLGANLRHPSSSCRPSPPHLLRGAIGRPSLIGADAIGLVVVEHRNRVIRAALGPPRHHGGSV
jgi:hypothetical protein